MVAISSFTRALVAVPIFAGIATARYWPVTVVSKVYETRTVTSTICYTVTVSGEPVTYTHSYTTTEIEVSYCTLTETEKYTDTVTTDRWKTDYETEYQTETDYETVEGPTKTWTETLPAETDTLYKSVTCTETLEIPTTVYIKKYKTETEQYPVPTTIYKHKYDTITLPGNTYYVTKIKGETKYIHKTEYVTVSEVEKYTDTVTDVKKYTNTVTDVEKYTDTVTDVKKYYYTNTVTDIDTVTRSTAYPVCSGVVTLYTTTLVTAPIFIPTATSYLYDLIYESYHVDTDGITAVYTSTANSISITRTTRPPQTTAYEPGFKTKQPVPPTPCETVTSTSTLTYDPEIATQVQIRSTFSTLVRDIPEPQTQYTPTTVVLPRPTTVVPDPTTVVPVVTYTAPTTSTYIPPTSTSADPTFSTSTSFTLPPSATGAANKLSGHYGVFAGFAVALMAMA